MIIDTINVSSVTRELTDLMRSYNIQILTIDYDDFEDQMIISFRASRIFEANEFKSLAGMLDEVINPAVLTWTSVHKDYRDMFTVGKSYSVLLVTKTMVQTINDLGERMLVSNGHSVYGDNSVERTK
ncbi:hypothetical protein KNT87_gp205 [Erwinia phage Cronus]|uniref:Uncharacterized protein n=1 Tax=Erwinia phage Cronus TaxID=2163633 RepID=A0A2S1GLW4_9CAUD|nr:hypothetical protein KNT87_gp205 [Erwinia phage Cronus]AWD90364.1 hypothetical protein [Erwinia phage Cronus]